MEASDRVDDGRKGGGQRDGGRGGFDLIQGDSDCGNIPKSDTRDQAGGKLACDASADHPVRRMSIAEGFFGSRRGGKEATGSG